MPLPRKFMNFSSQNDVIWCILGVLFLRFMCPMDWYSEVLLKGKNKTLVKIFWGREQRTTPAGQMLGGRDPCGVDAYGSVAGLDPATQISSIPSFTVQCA